MKKGKMMKMAALITFAMALGMFGYLVDKSKALSYLSSDPKACINCHVMHTQYATWQHSSHAQRATCVECHLPRDTFINKYAAEARDGWNHTVVFTANSYAQNIGISDDGANRVQKNCISCHARLTQVIVANNDRYHDYAGIPRTDRKCWDCHKEVPHGRVRSLSSTPGNLGVREL